MDPEKSLGSVDPLTMPKVVAPVIKKEGEGERKIELSEIIGIPDFDVSGWVGMRGIEGAGRRDCMGLEYSSRAEWRACVG